MSVCPQCGSTEITRHVMASNPRRVETGTPRFEGCRTCGYWEERVALNGGSLRHVRWLVTRTGQGPATAKSQRDWAVRAQ